VWALTAVYFLLLYGTYTNLFWMPLVIRNAGVSNVRLVGRYAAVPPCMGAISMIVVSGHSDRTGERRWHFVGLVLAGTVGFLLLAFGAQHLGLCLVGGAVVSAGLLGSAPVFWAHASTQIPRSAGPSAIALINSVGNLAGLFAPWIMGLIRARSGSFFVGYLVTTAVGISSALLMLAITRTAALEAAASQPRLAAQTSDNP
jgi:MFS family permease